MDLSSPSLEAITIESVYQIGDCKATLHSPNGMCLEVFPTMIRFRILNLDISSDDDGRTDSVSAIEDAPLWEEAAGGGTEGVIAGVMPPP